MRRIEHRVLARMSGEPDLLCSQTRSDIGEGLRILLPPANGVDAVGRERNEIAADAIERDAVLREERVTPPSAVRFSTMSSRIRSSVAFRSRQVRLVDRFSLNTDATKPSRASIQATDAMTLPLPRAHNVNNPRCGGPFRGIGSPPGRLAGGCRIGRCRARVHRAHTRSPDGDRVRRRRGWAVGGRDRRTRGERARRHAVQSFQRGAVSTCTARK